jgi:argininosuccinate lyase
MNKKLWGGRFKKGLDSDAKELSYSLCFDKRLLPYDIKTNLAYAKALAKEEIISIGELSLLEKFFNELSQKVENNELSFDVDDEDVHSYVERLTTEALGDVGKKLHTGKSRNDQVVTDMKLYMKAEIEQVLGLVEDTLKALYELAEKNVELEFPGFTHFQIAQPVLLAHHILAYFEMFYRDRDRLVSNLEKLDYCPLGSGAMAGNSFGLDRAFVAKELGFSKMTRNSMDAVADRDYMLEFCSNSSIAMMHMSRLCEELVLWNSPMIGFVTIGDEFTTGSSIMPQKKNPDIAELIRGKNGRVLGNYTALQHLIKALPLTYNRDLQEDKEIIFDTIDTLKLSLKCFSKMLTTVEFRKTAIQLALKKGYILATDFADYLVGKGVPFRTAHEVTGRVVLYASENNKHLEGLTLEELQKFSDKVDRDVEDVFDIRTAIDKKDSFGGTATKRVKYQLKKIVEEFQWNVH